MSELYNILNGVIPILLRFVPALLGFCFFVKGLRFALRILGGDLVFYRETKEPEIKEPECFDIPEKQKDFIQLN